MTSEPDREYVPIPGLFDYQRDIAALAIRKRKFAVFADCGLGKTLILLEFARHAVSLGGVVSAEHGLGKRKAHLLKLQYAPEHLEAMRAVKRRLDPQGMLGRGTLWAE